MSTQGNLFKRLRVRWWWSCASCALHGEGYPSKMDGAHAREVADAFGWGEVLRVEKSTEGVLNDNFRIETSRGIFFIKAVRQKKHADIPYIASVEKLMRDRGMPAVCMLQTLSGEIAHAIGERVYTAYVFIESDRSHIYRDIDFQNMGTMLARIHLAGSHDIPAHLHSRQFEEKDAVDRADTLRAYRNRILQKPKRDTQDEEFLPYIERKLRILETESVSSNTLPNTTLVHGDYHAGNLLMDTTSREIIGICDWEKSEMSPRAYELARSTLYICFQDAVDESAMANAHHFLDAYRAVYPIDAQELQGGFRLRLLRSAESKWIEESYYDAQDSRPLKFIASEDRILSEFVERSCLGELL